MSKWGDVFVFVFLVISSTSQAASPAVGAHSNVISGMWVYEKDGACSSDRCDFPDVGSTTLMRHDSYLSIAVESCDAGLDDAVNGLLTSASGERYSDSVSYKRYLIFQVSPVPNNGSLYKVAIDQQIELYLNGKKKYSCSLGNTIGNVYFNEKTKLLYDASRKPIPFQINFSNNTVEYRE